MTGRDKFWGKFQYVSEKQIELALNINAYRKKMNMSQREFAHLCNLYSEPYHVVFYPCDICNYERMKKAPRVIKYQVLCNVLKINTVND